MPGLIGRFVESDRGRRSRQHLTNSNVRSRSPASSKLIFREIAQDRGIDRVLAENRLVLTEAQAPQPTPISMMAS
jgi:hypothetical protein